VLTAFGVSGARPFPLSGGQGNAWLAGDLVLKPYDLEPEELYWQARIYRQVRCDRFRLARPQAAANGSLCVDGWYATQYLPGQHERRRWAEIIAVGELFHAAVRQSHGRDSWTSGPALGRSGTVLPGARSPPAISRTSAICRSWPPRFAP